VAHSFASSRTPAAALAHDSLARKGRELNCGSSTHALGAPLGAGAAGAALLLIMRRVSE
jgi:hypothetical protein